jgi:hypothetical protein
MFLFTNVLSKIFLALFVFNVLVLMFVENINADETKMRYKFSVIAENQKKTIQRLCYFFPEKEKSNLSIYDTKKTFAENIKRLGTESDDIMQILGMILSDVIEDSRIKPSDCDDYVKIRSASTKFYLEVLKYINFGIDPTHDYDGVIYLNIPYERDVVATNGMRYHSTTAGTIDPETIDDPVDRKKYAKQLWDNSVLANERRIQTYLIDRKARIPEFFNRYLIASYSRSPRADDELVELLEKYKYLETEKIKIFKALNIPYKGFREWRTNDGLLTLTAKVISINKKEVKIEKEDGKQFTIEIYALRKEDQDYVKKQLESEKKTVDDEKVKKD